MFISLLTIMTVSMASPEPIRRSWTFEDDAPGAIARGFRGVVGEWKVVATPEGKVLAQTAKSPDAVFNVALVEGIEVKDVDLSVRIKRVEGVDDQGGGLVWRAKDARNYYMAPYNHLEDNLRVYKVVDGVRTLFANADIKHGDGWATLRVTMKGDLITCEYDGKNALEHRDATFRDAGRIGVWSKADARTHFDNLTLSGNGNPLLAWSGRPAHARDTLTEIGFVVVQIDGMGASGGRNAMPRRVHAEIHEAAVADRGGPDSGAKGGPYGERRKRDFFVRNLLGVEPRH